MIAAQRVVAMRLIASSSGTMVADGFGYALFNARPTSNQALDGRGLTSVRIAAIGTGSKAIDGPVDSSTSWSLLGQIPPPAVQ